MKKTKPSFKEELQYWEKGIQNVIGIDEVGRGAFAGPIVAAAVVFSPDIKIHKLNGVNDSKLLLPKQRGELSEIVKENALFWSVETVDVKFINEFGIGKANIKVFRKVVSKLLTELNSKDYFVLIDGFHAKYLPGGLRKQKAIVKGDRKSLSIAAASIIAKVFRDNLMKEAGEIFPNYGFSKNKGYGTLEHRDALKLYGLSSLHRTSFNLSIR